MDFALFAVVLVWILHIAIIHKVLETNSSFHVKERTTGKVQFLFFREFLLLLTKFSFWEEDRGLGNNSVKF